MRPVSLSSAALVVVSSTMIAEGVNGWIAMDGEVRCHPTKSFACAMRQYTGPSPCCDEDGTCHYVGSYEILYTFTAGVADRTDIVESLDDTPVNGLKTMVGWEQDNTHCKGTVNELECASCSICSLEQKTFSFDCTNIRSGIRMQCESIEPVFYPLDDTFEYPTEAVATLSDDLQHLLEQEDPCAGSRGSTATNTSSQSDVAGEQDAECIPDYRARNNNGN